MRQASAGARSLWHCGSDRDSTTSRPNLSQGSQIQETTQLPPTEHHVGECSAAASQLPRSCRVCWRRLTQPLPRAACSRVCHRCNECQKRAPLTGQPAFLGGAVARLSSSCSLSNGVKICSDQRSLSEICKDHKVLDADGREVLQR